ncbi:MAG TPA: Ig-like domain-containing protein, partial [bacterium]|nr:Ig-like domain-containing protein [bacterium]
MNRQKGRVALRLLVVVVGAFVLAGMFLAAGKLLAWHVPWISIESPEAGEVVSGIIPVSCDYGVDAGNMHTLILYAAGAEVERVRIHDREGSYSFFFNTNGYSDGPVEIVVRAYTAAPPSGHFSATSINVTVDNSSSDDDPPEIDVISPDVGELFSVASVVLSASLIDDVAVDLDTVVVKLDGADITAQCDVSALSAFCSLSPADGAHTATIDCADTSGNAAPRASVSFVVDTTPPALAVTSHENGQVVTTPTITVSGTASDATSGVAAVEVNGEAATLSGGTWTMPGVSLDDGANAISVTAEDAAGHVANYILIINYDAPDTSKPVITIEEPTAGALLDAAPVVLSAELEDDEAVATATVVVKLNGTDVTAGCAVTPFSVICPLSPADGTHSATVDCKDTSNNAAVQKSVSFTLDTAPPVVSVTSHADGQVVVAPVITISGSASDAVSGVSAVEVNGEAATLLGGTWTFAGATLDEGLNAFVVSAQDVAGHSAITSLTINYVIPECSSDADCDDADVRTEDVCLNPGTAGAVCVHNGIECINDADCNDWIPLTIDVCLNPGTPQSACENTAVECNTNADCNDWDPLTIDVCLNPGTPQSVCENTEVACNTDADCNDWIPLTIDVCLNPGTPQSACENTAVECNTNADCNDWDPLTIDVCLNPETPQSVCENTAIECNTNADCNDRDPLTIDVCLNPGTPQSVCENTEVACNTDADCNDWDPLTIDVCLNPGT